MTWLPEGVQVRRIQKFRLKPAGKDNLDIDTGGGSRKSGACRAEGAKIWPPG